MAETPYGLRQVRIVTAAAQVIEFPISQTLDVDFQFSGAELKGDDILWKKIAMLESVKLTLKNGGLSMEAMNAILNATAFVSDATHKRLTLNGGEVVAPITLYGKSMGPDNDCVHVKFYKVTLDTMKFNMGQAAFSINDTTFTAVRDDDGRLCDIVKWNDGSTVLPSVRTPYVA